MSKTLSLDTSASTLLRRVRRLNELLPTKPCVVGVDDWAWRKGKRYGTLIVDLENHRPLELLPERTAQPLSSWLKRQPLSAEHLQWKEQILCDLWRGQVELAIVFVLGLNARRKNAKADLLGYLDMRED